MRANRRLYMQACGERKQQTSSAMTGGDRGGGICGLMCARKLGRGVQAYIHTNSKSRRSVSPPSCRGAQTCVYTNAALGARLRQVKHCAGLQRAKSGAIDVTAERFRWLAEVLKEALCAQSCVHK